MFKTEELNKNSWHWKVYVFNSQLIAAFKGSDSPHIYPTNTEHVGLCPYVRTIVLWGPLVALTYLIPIGAVFATIFYAPVAMAGFTGLLYLGLTVGTIVGIIALTGFLAIRYEKYQTNRLAQKNHDKHVDKQTKIGFYQIVKDYVIAVKTKFCPVLKVTDK